MKAAISRASKNLKARYIAPCITRAKTTSPKMNLRTGVTGTSVCSCATSGFVMYDTSGVS